MVLSENKTIIKQIVQLDRCMMHILKGFSLKPADPVLITLQNRIR